MSHKVETVLEDLIEEQAVVPVSEGNISGVRHVEPDAEQGKAGTSTASLPTGTGRKARASALRASQRVSSWAETESLPFTAVAGHDIYITEHTKSRSRQAQAQREASAAAAGSRRRRSPTTPEPEELGAKRTRSGGRGGSPEPPSGEDSDWCSSGDELYGCAKCRYAWKGCGSCRERRPAFVRPKSLRWQPASGRPQQVPAVKMFYPTVEEFQDPMAYIAKITPEACQYGAAHIVPPPGEFEPPFALERGTTGASMESFRFSIRRQPTSKLSRRSPDRLTSSGAARGTGENAVRGRCSGGACLMPDENSKEERKANDDNGLTTNTSTLEHSDDSSDDSSSGSEFGFPVVSRTHTLRSFAAYADWARAQHFSGAPLVPGSRQAVNQRRPPGAGAPREPLPAPTLEQVEAEFWRLVEDPRDPEDLELGSLYGQDLDSGLHGSGFPLPRWRREMLAQALQERGQQSAAEAILNDRSITNKVGPSGTTTKDTSTSTTTSSMLHWAEHPWNVNNMPRAASSVLAHASSPDGAPITGVMVPWLYVGSALSAFSWHVEDHALYSVNYHHLGAEKVWYCVPPLATRALEDAMRDALPELFKANPGLIYGLVTMLSPAELQRRNVPVYRLVQRPGEFVVTMPNSYHGGFNTGFNCAEAVNFAPAPWIPFGTDILDKYRASKKPLTFSHDSLLVALVRKGIEDERSRLEHDDATMKKNITGGRMGNGSPLATSSNDGETGHDRALSSPASGSQNGADARRSARRSFGSVPSGTITHSAAHVPVETVCLAAGDLALRATEERRRLAVGAASTLTWSETLTVPRDSCCAEQTKQDPNRNAMGRSPRTTLHSRKRLGVVDGPPTDTTDADCIVCACDLWLSAIWTPALPDAMACPEHVSELAERASSSDLKLILLQRYTPEQLEELVACAARAYPGVHEAVQVASTRKARNEAARVRCVPCGPLYMRDTRAEDCKAENGTQQEKGKPSDVVAKMEEIAGEMVGQKTADIGPALQCIPMQA